ncbi:MAG: tetratricopeptide repeat protein [Paramuribaculum sp.]|nr:tetratricopeptide repeat protein [Paramuribaculum sp.]
MKENSVNMTQDTLSSLQASVRADAAAGRFCRMFDTVDIMVGSDPGSADMARALRTQYDALCSYAMAGAPDASRQLMRADIGSAVIELADKALHAARAAESPKLYYARYRYENLRNDSIRSLIEEYVGNNSTLSMALLTGASDVTTPQGESLLKKQEELAVRIFNKIWTTPSIVTDAFHAIDTALRSDTLPSSIKESIIWALMLGGLEVYQGARLLSLGRFYVEAGSQRLRMSALAAFLVLLWRHRDIAPGVKLTGVLDMMRSRSEWTQEVRLMSMQLIRTRDTERISSKLKTEVFPAMMKLRPGLEKLGELGPDSDLSALEDNPEWEEILDKSGLTDKLKELTDLQSEGADLMMATFSNLKSFPFFNEVAHWFTPFATDRSEVKPVLAGGLSGIAEIIAASPFLCDSDKFSMIFSLDHIPSAQRELFASQLKAQDINAAELRAGSLDVTDKAGESVARTVVQNLYRFFKLFRRKGEFYDPFANTPDLTSLPALRDALGNTENIRVVAEFFFKRGYYQEALVHFKELLADNPNDYQLLQKAGYCHAAEGDMTQAIEMYRRSELLAPDSEWTLRRLASAYRLVGDLNTALEYYRRLEALRPDDLNTSLAIGHCLLETGNYADALKMYFKVEYLAPQSKKTIRPIAWCLFLTGDYGRSKSYYDKVLEDSPTAADFINRGHLAMATGDFKEACEYYRKSIGVSSPARFESALSADMPALLSAGVDLVLIEIVTDKALNDE